eukprot:131366_1
MCIRVRVRPCWRASSPMGACTSSRGWNRESGGEKRQEPYRRGAPTAGTDCQAVCMSARRWPRPSGLPARRLRLDHGQGHDPGFVTDAQPQPQRLGGLRFAASGEEQKAVGEFTFADDPVLDGVLRQIPADILSHL